MTQIPAEQYFLVLARKLARAAACRLAILPLLRTGTMPTAKAHLMTTHLGRTRQFAGHQQSMAAGNSHCMAGHTSNPSDTETRLQSCSYFLLCYESRLSCESAFWLHTPVLELRFALLGIE